MFNDIFKINQKLSQIDFDSLSFDEKKSTLTNELVKYIKEKIDLYNKKQRKHLYGEDDNIYELLNTLDSLVPYDSKEELSKFIHFVLSIASGMQGFSITWYEEDRDDLIDNPEVSFNRDNLWDSVSTYKGANLVHIFYFVYDIFMNQFIIRPKKTEPEIDSATLRLLYRKRA